MAFLQYGRSLLEMFISILLLSLTLAISSFEMDWAKQVKPATNQCVNCTIVIIAYKYSLILLNIINNLSLHMLEL